MFMDNEYYRIQKERVAVTITTVSGETIAGELFVQSNARSRTGREEAPDILNDPEPFFPFLGRDGEAQLIAKAQVREVELPGDLPEAEWRIDSWQEIEVVLVGGVHRKGVLYLERLSGRTRVLDYINRTALSRCIQPSDLRSQAVSIAARASSRRPSRLRTAARLVMA